MTEIFAISSGKGGVGKTFFSINISAALANLGKKVLLVDANLTTPNVSINLKLHEKKKTLHDVLKENIGLREAIVKTNYGFDIVPASLSIQDLIGTDPEKLSEVLYDVIGLYDYIILDTSASLGRETLSAIKASERVIIITIPEKAAIVDAYKVIKICDTLMIPVFGVVVNRYSKDSKIKIFDIEMYLGKPVIGIIHEDNKVRESMEQGIPLIYYNKGSIAAKDLLKIASKIIGEKIEIIEKEEKNIFQKILSLFRWK